MSYLGPAAIDVIRSAPEIIRHGTNIVRAADSAFGSLKRLRMGSNVWGARSASRKGYHPRRFSRRRVRKFTRRRKRVFRRKVKKYSRVAPRLPRKTVYTRKRKGLRKGNTGLLNLQKRIQAGESLPEQTFARFYFRASQSVGFRTAVSKPPQPGPDDVLERTLVLNDISGSPVGNNPTANPDNAQSMYGQIMYKKLWSMLYSQYQILGAKLKLKIRPVVYPRTLAGYVPDVADNYDNSVPPTASTGYYYIRVHYTRSRAPGDSQVTQVGHPLNIQHDEDDWTENWWKHERDFLNDTSVIWKRDTSSVRTKLHTVRTGTFNDSINDLAMYPHQGFTQEIECSNKPVYLTCKFSAKKMFQTKDILRNGYWNRWHTQLDTLERFYVRYGYIGFYDNGTKAFHIPIDRSTERSVDIDITYFAALRGPLIQPSMYDEENSLLAKEIPEEELNEDSDIETVFTDEEM